MLSTAAKIQRTKNIVYERRAHGRFFQDARSSYSPPSHNVLFLLTDCLEPPFSAESFDLIGALNLLDNVKLPLVLIGQMDALLRPSGKLVMGSPYEWRPQICEPREWLEGAGLDGPEMVRKILEGKMVPQMGLKYEILEELMDVSWELRHQDRHWSTFLLHLIKAQKMNKANRAN
jgi:SAM-dependent methyltransferase